ncbi:MAG: homoserine acetyltransferase, partial [Staphylococcus epidermidis]|nr:homoserine acetyltransferase [Staphylococcus epidermidis]
DEVVSYQQHQGDKFKEYFDLNCYLTLLDVLDSHHLDRGRDDVDEVFQSLETKVLTMGFIDDLLYPDDQVRALGERFNGFLLNFNDWAPNLYHFLNLKQFRRK